MRFQRKPQFVEAVQYDGTPESADEVTAFIEEAGFSVFSTQHIFGEGATLTVEGGPDIYEGKWLWREAGRWLTATDASFRGTYEPAAEAASTGLQPPPGHGVLWGDEDATDPDDPEARR